jgi:hypothetical protein
MYESFFFGSALIVTLCCCGRGGCWNSHGTYIDKMLHAAESRTSAVLLQVGVRQPSCVAMWNRATQHNMKSL